MQKRHNHLSTSAADDEFIRRFVASFEQLNDLRCLHSDPLPDELRVGLDVDDWNLVRWPPAEILTPREELEPIYRRLPGRFPELYERLVLSYRWLEVDLRTITLLANPPGPLSALADAIFRDRAFVDVLIPAGFVLFARPTDLNYDPVCFDLNSMHNGDCPVVRFEHEAILCNGKIGDVELLNPSFRELMLRTIELAQHVQPGSGGI